jgi:NADH-quinone oxidoreductase subunit C
LSSSDTQAPEAEADEAPRDEAREALLAELTAELGDAVVGSHILAGQDLWVRVTRDAWRRTHEVAQRKVGLRFFDFLSAIDWLPSPFGRDMDSQEDLAVHGAEPKEPAAMAQGHAGGDTRFQVFTRVASTTRHLGVILKVDLPDDDLSVDSLVPVYPGANWHERECREMFGISFTGHPNPINLYLPGEFEGYPLRKDFPLLSRRMKPWPGIVDVEPMPGDDSEGEGEDA